MATARGITETKIYDRQAVIDRYGIPPGADAGLLGLKGDTSDNIPGIPGIGDKTASELIQRFGTLEEVLAHVERSAGPSANENLTEHADDARMSKQLATMQRGSRARRRHRAGGEQRAGPLAVREVFREYELRDPLRRLEEALGDAAEAAPGSRPPR